MSRKYTKKEPDEPMPIDKSVYDVPIDYQLIDYIASTHDMTRFDPENDGLKKSHTISLLAEGWTNSTISKGLGISRSTLEIWEQSDPLYKHCLDFIHQIEIKDTEQMVWRTALLNPNATNERAMAVRSEIAKYRDNALPPTTNVTMLRISLNGQELDVSANFKPITDTPLLDDSDD